MRCFILSLYNVEKQRHSRTGWKVINTQRSWMSAWAQEKGALFLVLSVEESKRNQIMRHRHQEKAACIEHTQGILTSLRKDSSQSTGCWLQGVVIWSKLRSEWRGKNRTFLGYVWIRMDDLITKGQVIPQSSRKNCLTTFSHSTRELDFGLSFRYMDERLISSLSQSPRGTKPTQHEAIQNLHNLK